MALILRIGVTASSATRRYLSDILMSQQTKNEPDKCS